MSEETLGEPAPKRKACDVCLGRFIPVLEDQRRCGEACRAFARENRYLATKAMQNKWRQTRPPPALSPCPSGKVRHQRKKGALKSARDAGSTRFTGMPSFLMVYECPLCKGWHLTSKSPRFSRP